MNIVKGDLIKMAEEGQFDVIVHGCNCFHTMGAGIAFTIAHKFPHIAEIDRRHAPRGSREMLGTYSFGTCFTRTNPVKTFVIVNAYTQYMPSFGDDVFEYESFRHILNVLLYKEYDAPGQSFRFGFPWIGCGLAGGDKTRVQEIIQEFADKIEARPDGGSVTIVEFEL